MSSLPPIEPSGDFRQGALAVRGMFLAYIEVGFTEEQAMRLILTHINAGGRGET